MLRVKVGFQGFPFGNPLLLGLGFTLRIMEGSFLEKCFPHTALNHTLLKLKGNFLFAFSFTVVLALHTNHKTSLIKWLK